MIPHSFPREKPVDVLVMETQYVIAGDNGTEKDNGASQEMKKNGLANSTLTPETASSNPIEKWVRCVTGL